ncbi:hypothetical protein DFP72DRAFT_845047 [Ephemerocybe angulata]|uniref:Uncharacterized protein n=1 Tax=Ephemerocybe angulata TaxID=980116 RepID=A0A8H6I4G5_9AGAR|nr:hypothetical protein DFP72DRAFT_845047 [Tulosesus angulatus]
MTRIGAAVDQPVVPSGCYWLAEDIDFCSPAMPNRNPKIWATPPFRHHGEAEELGLSQEPEDLGDAPTPIGRTTEARASKTPKTPRSAPGLLTCWCQFCIPNRGRTTLLPAHEEGRTPAELQIFGSQTWFSRQTPESSEGPMEEFQIYEASLRHPARRTPAELQIFGSQTWFSRQTPESSEGPMEEFQIYEASLRHPQVKQLFKRAVLHANDIVQPWGEQHRKPVLEPCAAQKSKSSRRLMGAKYERQRTQTASQDLHSRRHPHVKQLII